MKIREMPIAMRMFLGILLAIFASAQSVHGQELKLQNTVGGKEDGARSAVFSPDSQGKV